MFHVKHLDGPIAAEHFGGDLKPDWRVERRPDGTFYWVVTDWDDHVLAHGTTTTLGEAVAQGVKWAT